jgi:hypothetical protein
MHVCSNPLSRIAPHFIILLCRMPYDFTLSNTRQFSLSNARRFYLTSKWQCRKGRALSPNGLINKFFVGLHGDKTYTSHILLALMKIWAYGSKAFQ